MDCLDDDDVVGMYEYALKEMGIAGKITTKLMLSYIVKRVNNWQGEEPIDKGKEEGEEKEIVKKSFK